MKSMPSKTVLAWCLYDWANSAFTTLVVTFVYATYFTREMAGSVTGGTVLWSRAVGISAVLVAILSPLLGALADQRARRHSFLTVATLVCVTFTAALAFVRPAQEHAVVLALSLFVVANVAYELGIVFYNAFLPQIAANQKIGRISGYGWGLGYAGGILSMLIAFLLLLGDAPLLHISTAEGFNVRAANIFVAAWFLLFSLPLLFLAPRESKPASPFNWSQGLANFKATLLAVRQYREVMKFLIAHLIYNDGLVTIFAFGGIYAAGTFGMSLSEVMIFGIVLNMTAGLGALMFGFIDDIIGGKATVMISIAALFFSTIIAVLAPNKFWFWCAGILIGIFVGPNQSASRSLMGRMVPAERQTEFFGFYTLSGKITSFFGPILLGTVTAMFDSQRHGVATILLFFLTGGILLWRVDEKQGVAEAIH